MLCEQTEAFLYEIDHGIKNSFKSHPDGPIKDLLLALKYSSLFEPFKRRFYKISKVL